MFVKLGCTIAWPREKDPSIAWGSWIPFLTIPIRDQRLQDLREAQMIDSISSKTRTEVDAHEYMQKKTLFACGVQISSSCYFARAFCSTDAKKRIQSYFWCLWLDCDLTKRGSATILKLHRGRTPKGVGKLYAVFYVNPVPVCFIFILPNKLPMPYVFAPLLFWA